MKRINTLGLSKVVDLHAVAREHGRLEENSHDTWNALDI